MKTKFWVICVLSGILLMTSCDPADPSQNINGATCINAILPYYPYTIDENFVYVNEELDRTWEAAPRIINGKYPEVVFDGKDDFDVNGNPGKSNGNWEASVNVQMLELNPPAIWDWSQISTIMTYSKWNKEMLIVWYFKICLSEEEHFSAHNRIICASNEALSYFSDTILLTDMIQEHGAVPLPDGVYARIVKNEGLTDFSVDGATVWRRVKQ